MSRPSYPHPASSSSPPQRLTPHIPLLPLLSPPPRSAPFHPLPPSSSSGPSPLPGYRHSTHLVPAAYPRTLVNSTSPPAAQTAGAKWPPVETGERASRTKVAEEDAREIGRRTQPGVEELVKEGERIGVDMEFVVERFVKIGGAAGWEGRGGKKQVTLVMGGANGLPVEDWYFPLHTTFSHLSSAGWLPFEIVEIWLLNTPLTDPSHGPVYTWSDNARDYTHFLTHYLPLEPSPGLLPEILERRDEPATRPGVVSVGHSFTATTFFLAELERGSVAKGGEAMCEGMVLVDPMIMDPKSKHFIAARSTPTKPSPFMRGAIGRPDVWGSRADLKPALLKSPFFQSFHPTQLASYITYGFVPLSAQNQKKDANEKMTLRFPRWAESLVFARGDTLADVWERLQVDRESIGNGCRSVRFVFPGKGEISGSRATRAQLAHFLPSSVVSNVIVPSAGHLIVQEAPIEMGHILGEFLVDLFGGGSGSGSGSEGGRESKL